MEFSCESFTHPKKRRPRSSKFVELHVLYVPDDQWNGKLNKVPADATESFISAGFIRVYPDITLKTLRSELGILLGTDRRIDRFSFLKCVGRSLALVKSEQESDLKVKTFAPPYALQPELYLLPVAESDSSVCSSQSLTSDAPSCSDHQAYYLSKTCSLTTGTKAPVKFPPISQSSQQSPPTPSPDEEEEEEEEEEEGEVEEESYSSTDEENEEEPLSSQTDAAQVKASPAEGETAGRKEKQSYGRNRAARDSGIPESLEDRDSGFSVPQDRFRKSKDMQTLKVIRNKPNNTVPEHAVGPSTRPPPQAHNSALDSDKTAAAPVFQTNRDELMDEIKLAREERKRLEWTRQELLRKGKDLLAQNRHRRNQARDRWKKKYFETKKATAPLDETLKNLRQELETFYNKLLHQLQARDNRGKPRRQGRGSTKNELIIQIMTESYEIDNLKRKLEDAKMKLVTEIKLRKQAATELRALRAELAQKKSQSSHSGPMASLGFDTAARDRPPAQSTNA